jgi:hypothetical protein
MRPGTHWRNFRGNAGFCFWWVVTALTGIGNRHPRLLPIPAARTFPRAESRSSFSSTHLLDQTILRWKTKFFRLCVRIPHRTVHLVSREKPSNKTRPPSGRSLIMATHMSISLFQSSHIGSLSRSRYLHSLLSNFLNRLSSHPSFVADHAAATSTMEPP